MEQLLFVLIEYLNTALINKNNTKFVFSHKSQTR